MTGTHFSKLSGHRDYGNTLPSNPVTGQEYFDVTSNTHYIYDGSQWWATVFTTSTSSSTTTTTTSTSSTTSTSTSSSTSSTTTSTSTTV